MSQTPTQVLSGSAPDPRVRRGWGLVAYRRLEPEIRQLLVEGHTVRMIFDMKEAQLPVSYPQFVKLVRQYADKPLCAVPPSASAALVSTAEPPSFREGTDWPDHRHHRQAQGRSQIELIPGNAIS